MSTKTAPASTVRSTVTTSPRSRNKKSRPAAVKPSGRDLFFGIIRLEDLHALFQEGARMTKNDRGQVRVISGSCHITDITHCLLFEGFERAKLGCLGVGVMSAHS